MDSTGTLAQALDAVGPRLKRIRATRALTLAEVSATTGVSTSTLSRLETGQRRPSLELLLPLARTYRVPLDELVGAPDVGDPRVRLRPRQANGRTVVPLTPRPGGVQAWKILVPARHDDPTLRTHAGHEWLYVLRGRMRLLLGGHDLVLGAGEAAEFDTRVPHWFGSTDGQEAEVLSLFGRQGERVHVRASAARREEHEPASARP